MPVSSRRCSSRSRISLAEPVRNKGQFATCSTVMPLDPEQGEYAPIRGLIVISVVDSMGRRNRLASRS